MRSCFVFITLALCPACGSTSPPAGPYVNAVTPPEIENPPLACETADASCSCAPSDAGEGGAPSASPTACDQETFADASCCIGPDYPFAGNCTCGYAACMTGYSHVPSCSNPPASYDAGTCSPATCGGMSCGGGYCCTSSCVGGMCMSSCS
jgi:hypothetical protein